MNITNNQLRAARALLGLDQKDVENGASVSLVQISRIERGEVEPKNKTIKKLTDFYTLKGVEFTDGDGVRRKQLLRELRGYEGFQAFNEDVYETVKNGGNVCVSNVDERLFEKWQGKNAENYLSKMAELGASGHLNFHILIKKGDKYFTASKYAEYRWVPAAQFSSVPFYIYGDKVATILFEDDVKIFIHEHSELAQAHRAQFDLAWSVAEKTK